MLLLCRNKVDASINIGLMGGTLELYSIYHAKIGFFQENLVENSF